MCIIANYEFADWEKIIFANETCNAFANTISLMVPFIYRFPRCGHTRWLMSHPNNLLMIAMQKKSGTEPWLHPAIFWTLLICCIQCNQCTGFHSTFFAVATIGLLSGRDKPNAHYKVASFPSILINHGFLVLSFSPSATLRPCIDPFCEMMLF